MCDVCAICDAFRVIAVAGACECEEMRKREKRDEYVCVRTRKKEEKK